MRRMFVSRSSLEKPRPFERCVRTSSPSRSSECRPRRVSSDCSAFAMVDLPAPDRPVNQTTNPWLIAIGPGFAAMRSPRSWFPPVDAAFLHLALLPPPPSRPLVLAGLRGSRAGRAADRRVAALVEGVVGHLVLVDVRPHLVRRPRLEARHDDDAPEGLERPAEHGLGVCVQRQGCGQERAHAGLASGDATLRRASNPTRSVQSPKPSVGMRSARNASNSGRSRPGISCIGTLGAYTRLSRVPSKSPPSITSYLPSVVPTKPTSPR